MPTGIAANAVTGMEAMDVTFSHDPTDNGNWGLLPQALDLRVSGPYRQPQDEGSMSFGQACRALMSVIDLKSATLGSAA